ncbi:response regulator transcription factor [Peptostreptococcus canis]|uniref:Stage 0 sporulation protein A homolog n=1 Tax=Peptostreptococcus canis TaxID=1159213 RepID=A0ABR6TIB3_9FIRM|nr:response regulator transcription factor [Peptostreptococcus canis]MBC2575152.1 response regulator transcription factor [Peptostreptococcus canis]MBP1997674.1 DNA-binding response OmpR family regulator [Peptostreptococcus canis]
MKGKIYVADDEKNIRDLIKSFLAEEGHEVVLFEDGESLLEAFYKSEPDIVILDVMMPGMDGFTLCTKIRKKSDVPILLLTARDTDADYITGFTAGCDDYFTKPFSPVKLTMRVNAILKRSFKENNSSQDRELFYGDITINNDLKTFMVNEKQVKLTNTEFELMNYLLVNKERAVSREELLSSIWGYDTVVETRVTDDMIKRIRKKLRENNSIVSIDTVWGFGFKLESRD